MIQKYDVVRLRSRLGLSQEKFAEKLGVCVSSVGKWETGWHKPRGLSLRAINVTIEESRFCHLIEGTIRTK